MKSIMMSLIASLMVFLPARAAMMTEAQIAQIMKIANENEEDMGKLGHKKAQSDSVKNFAEKMQTEHKDNEKQEKDVAHGQKISFDKSEDSKALKSQGEAKLKDLKKLDKVDFDRAYMAAMVDEHQNLLDKLNNEFIPAATTPAFKQYLMDTKNHVQSHLDEAKKISTSL